ncbi:hypothetical protein QYE76_046490 [Lolium multiflorum]|uniref:non-specific serine/threonine protein kinase n=1 Tax=Lolium multiflorum TaxID=4521 RepID=A0AAD8TPX9_LOLMU|nr:hypothetical protein QYE76_046490 [Lolium multiflorum]
MCGVNCWSFLPFLLFLIIPNLSSFASGYGQFSYYGFDNTNISLDGAAEILPGRLLQLTNGEANIKGHAFYPAPLHFRKSPNGTVVESFSASFVFGIIPTQPALSSEGIAFVIAPTKDFSDALPAQYLGVFNNQNNGNPSNHIFSVELDTVQNPEFQDIDANHVGINLHGLISWQSSPAGFYDDSTGQTSNLSLASGNAMQVWVDYDGEAGQIDVTLAPFKRNKPTKPLVSTSCNLSLVLTEVAYVGLSSAAGSVGSRHYILGWSFNMNGQAAAFFTAEKELPDLPRVPRKAARNKVLQVSVPIATATSVFLVGLVVFLVARRRLQYAEVQEDWEVEFGPHRFSFKDLFRATEGFKNRYLLGRGGFGRVYKGVLQKSKLEIAVKRVSHESTQGIREFIAEIVSIGRLRHRNVVQLLGYCRRKGELLLVYDYMPNGSLDRYLYGHGDRPSLDWMQRFRIIRGVASGLLYLHGEWEQVVIHRDVKASNVLLDEDMNGRLGDFGLARLYDHGTDMQTTHLVGTIGYLAPELIRTGKASPFTDVFAFGIFALEVACGRRPIDHRMNSNQLLLVDWVFDLWRNGSIIEAMDSRLLTNYDVDEACLVLKLGLLCSHESATARPSMWHVMQYLNRDLPFPDLSSSEWVRSQRADSPVAYYQPVVSSGTMSGLSGGR